MIEDRTGKSQQPEPVPIQSIEGWIVIVTNIDEEVMEDEIFDEFGDCGQIKGLNFNFDRRTGMAKGYALIEYEKYEEALAAITEKNGHLINEKPLKVDWAFVAGTNPN